MHRLKLKEKFYETPLKDYNGYCPICRGKGETRVLPFGDDIWFCENPHCGVTRFASKGYYKITEESVVAPNVNYVELNMMIKRK